MWSSPRSRPWPGVSASEEEPGANSDGPSGRLTSGLLVLRGGVSAQWEALGVKVCMGWLLSVRLSSIRRRGMGLQLVCEGLSARIQGDVDRRRKEVRVLGDRVASAEAGRCE